MNKNLRVNKNYFSILERPEINLIKNMFFAPYVSEMYPYWSWCKSRYTCGQPKYVFFDRGTTLDQSPQI